MKKLHTGTPIAMSNYFNTIQIVFLFDMKLF